MDRPVIPGLPAGVTPVKVAALSDAASTTWDLGPDPASPGKRLYAVAIRQGLPAPEATIPGRLGEAPLGFGLVGGGRAEWSFKTSRPLPVESRPVVASDERKALEAIPEGSARVLSGENAIFVTLRPGGLALESELRLPTDALAYWKAGKTSGGLLVITRGNRPQLAIRLSGARAEVTPIGATGRWSVRLSPEADVTLAESAGGGWAIDAVVTPTASGEGENCWTLSTDTTQGFFATGASFVGRRQPDPAPDNIKYCRAYLTWPLSSVPQGSTIYNSYVWPLNYQKYAGSTPAAIDVYLRDIEYDTPVPVNAYNYNYYLDYGSMRSGRPDYATFTTPSAAGASYSAYLTLGSQAVLDLNGATRGSGTDTFSIGFVATLNLDDYIELQSTSELYVYYSNYEHNQVVLQRLAPFEGAGSPTLALLYNYGEDIDISGWQISSVNYAGTTQSFTITETSPGAGRILRRHDGLEIMDTADGAWGGSGRLITGGNLFTWDNGAGNPDPLRVSLLRASGSGADYACFAGAVAAPPAGTGWAGSCPTLPAGFTMYARTRDTDTDGGGDWGTISFVGGGDTNPGQTGSRRRSDVVINGVLIWDTYNWIELLNLGPSVNVNGWSVVMYNSAGSSQTYTVPSSTTLSTGERMWLVEGTRFGTAGYPAADNNHINMGNDLTWDIAPRGGEILLRDEGVKVRDRVVFGDKRPSSDVSLNWIGASVPLSDSATNQDLRRLGDLSTQSAGDWGVSAYVYANWFTEPGWSPDQRVTDRVQDEVGIQLSSANGGYTAAHGYGPVLTVTQQVGLERFAIPGFMKFESGTSAYRMVVKKQSTGTIIYDSGNFSGGATGINVITSPLISPPEVLDPGDYALMLYANGPWEHFTTAAGDIEKLSFGSWAGMTGQNGFAPTGAYAEVTPAYPVHSYFSVIHPPLITNPSVWDGLTFDYPLPDAQLTVPYSFTHASTGGYGTTRTWTITVGALPPGLTLSPAGVVSGTPTQDGVYTFTVRVTDQAGLWRERLERITVRGRLAVATSALPYYDRMNLPYSFFLKAYGGVAPLNWSCSGLPAGLSCDPATGEITGITTVANGPYSALVTVNDANGLSANKTLTLQVYYSPAILTTSLADGYVGKDYGVQKILAAGGTSTIVWSVSAGALPPGLSFNTTTAEITGTPTAEGVYNFSITYDPTGGLATQAYTITVREAVVPDYWVRRGLAGGTVKDLFYSPNFTNDKTVVASSGSSLYLSSDGGYFWTRLPKFKPTPGASNGQVVLPKIYSVVFDPGFDGRVGFGNKTIYVASSSLVEQFLKSTDAGLNWNELPTSTGTFSCGDRMFRYGSHVYCLGTNNAASAGYGPYTLHRALYASATWTFNERNVLELDRAFLADNGFIYAYAGGYPDSHLYLSIDQGLNWSDYESIPTPLSDLSISPNFGTTRSIAYVSQDDSAGLATTLQVSFDYGRSFTPQATIYNLTDAAFDPGFNNSANRRIFASGRAGTGKQFMQSTDGGVTFSPTGGGGMPNYKFSGGFRFSPLYGTDTTIMALGDNGAALFRSVAAGIGWGPSENGLYYQKINTVTPAPNFATTRRAFVGTDSSIYYTDDGGKIWRAAALNGSSSNFRKIRSLVVAGNYASSGVVFALGCGPAPTSPLATECRLMKSSNGGLNFSDTGAVLSGSSAWGSDVQGAEDLFLTPNYSVSVPRVFLKYPGGKGMNFYRSINDGATFSLIDDCYRNFSFTVSPGYATDSTLYTACGYNGDANLKLSTDGGTTFIDMSGGPFTSGFRPSLAPTYNRISGTNGTASKTIIAGGQKSTDGGTSFAAIDTESAGSPIFSPNYATDNTLFNYYITSGSATGLYKSTNGGTTMVVQTVVGDGTPFYDTNQIAPAPNYSNGSANQTVFVATGAGLYQTDDGGTNWTLSTGTQSFSDQVTAAAQDPNRKGRLYMGSFDDGIVYSDDDGETTRDITLNLKSGTLPYQVRSMLAVDNLSTVAAGDTVLLASTANGLFYMVIDVNGVPAANWTLSSSVTSGQKLSTDGTYCYWARNTTTSRRALISGGCASWASFTLDSQEIGFTSLTGPTVPLTGAAAKPKGNSTDIAAGSADAYWSANLASGAQHSPTGTGYTPSPGTNDYTLPATSGYVSIQPMGINAQSAAREVVMGHSTLGVFLSTDGGDTWRNVSGPGSGLEATSKNATTFLLTQTTYGTTDVLVGVNGTTNGGVYLSGDGGSHWTQVNQGYDPNTLSIATLAKTACNGCPVQYYSGSYGGGMYTRTISVVPAPFYATPATWCTGAGCTCGSGAFTGPVQGGTSFKLCGSNFQTGAVVTFDDVPATGCSVSGGSNPNFTVITCTTPPHAAGAAVVRVRNPDTRAKQLAQAYTYTAASGRIGNTLKAAKSGVNGNLSWLCSLANCPANNPMRLYRSQNTAFSLYLENYNAGPGGTMTGGCTNAAGNNSCYMDATGVMTNTRSYFWVVE